MSFFQAHNLKVGYSGRIVVDGIDFDLNPGEILCLLGPNGSGKSTIIKTIINNLDIIDGHISYLSRDMEKFSARERARNMSIVLTERVEPEMMTGLEVVSTGRYPYTNHFGRLDEEDLAIIEESIDIVNGQDLMDKEFSRLSDGERQRIMIARAICQGSDIMVLDEPTSFLDIRYKLELLNILNTLSVEKGKTIIMSLHEIDLVSKIADKVLLIHQGKVFKYGSPEQVIRDENIERAYDLEAGSFNTSVGIMELSRTGSEKSNVFLIGGGGKGIHIYRALNRANIPFDVGVIFENDMDYNTAKPLAESLVIEEAFKEISDKNLKEAKLKIDQCEYLIDSGVSLSGINKRNGELIEYASRRNKKIYSLREEDLYIDGITYLEDISDLVSHIKSR